MSAYREPHPLLEHALLKSEKSAKGNFLSIILLFGHQMFLPLSWISVSLSFVKVFSSCTLSHCFCTPTHVPEIIFIHIFPAKIYNDIHWDTVNGNFFTPPLWRYCYTVFNGARYTFCRFLRRASKYSLKSEKLQPLSFFS